MSLLKKISSGHLSNVKSSCFVIEHKNQHRQLGRLTFNYIYEQILVSTIYSNTLVISFNGEKYPQQKEGTLFVNEEFKEDYALECSENRYYMNMEALVNVDSGQASKFRHAKNLSSTLKYSLMDHKKSLVSFIDAFVSDKKLNNLCVFIDGVELMSKHFGITNVCKFLLTLKDCRDSIYPCYYLLNSDLLGRKELDMLKYISNGWVKIEKQLLLGDKVHGLFTCYITKSNGRFVTEVCEIDKDIYQEENTKINVQKFTKASVFAVKEKEKEEQAQPVSSFSLTMTEKEKLDRDKADAPQHKGDNDLIVIEDEDMIEEDPDEDLDF